jgi:hypothetical protein
VNHALRVTTSVVEGSPKKVCFNDLNLVGEVALSMVIFRPICQVGW